MAIRRAEFPLPDVEDPLTAGFFAGAARGELCIPRCEGCARWRWYPEETQPPGDDRDRAGRRQSRPDKEETQPPGDDRDRAGRRQSRPDKEETRQSRPDKEEGSCPACGGLLAWTATSGRGRLFSWAVVRRAFLPAFAEMVPFVTALVTLDDDPAVRIVSYVVDAAPESLRDGMPLEAVFRPLRFPTVPDRAVVVPMFRPVP